MEVTVEMHTRPNCGYCDKAKEWLADRGVPFAVVVHDDVVEWELWKSNNRAKGAPWIFVDGDAIGGFDQLQLAEGLFR